MEFKLAALDRKRIHEIEMNSYFFEDDKPTYDKAFLRHFRCAEALSKAELFRESYLTFLLSVECLLKDLFVLLRAHHLGPDPRQSQVMYLFSSASKKEKSLGLLLDAGKFSHDLAALIKATKDFFPELDKQDPPRFASLATAIDPKLDWISERYQAPDDQAVWKDKCEKIEKAIKDFVKEDL
jgi:hypothetical protein